MSTTSWHIMTPLKTPFAATRTLARRATITSDPSTLGIHLSRGNAEASVQCCE